MGFHMLKLHIRCLGESLKCTNLVNDSCFQLLPCQLHFSSPKTHQIRESWMCADSHFESSCKPDRFLHRHRVACVKSTCNVCRGYVGHYLFIIPNLEISEAFA